MCLICHLSLTHARCVVCSCSSLLPSPPWGIAEQFLWTPVSVGLVIAAAEWGHLHLNMLP